MTLSARVSLPFVQDVMVHSTAQGLLLTPHQVTWFNELVEILGEYLVEGRDTVGGTATHQLRLPFLQLPSMSTSRRDLVANPPDGLIFYNTTIPAVQARVGGAWVNL